MLTNAGKTLILSTYHIGSQKSRDTCKGEAMNDYDLEMKAQISTVELQTPVEMREQDKHELLTKRSKNNDRRKSN